MRTGKFLRNGMKVLLAAMMLVAMFNLSVLAAEYVDMVPDGSNVYASGVDLPADTDVYNRIVISKPGVLGVTGIGVGDYYKWSLSVTLCDSSLKPLEDSVYVNVDEDKAAIFAVKAGVYYIKVSSEKRYALAAQFTPVNEKSGASKKKAKTIKKNKTITGLMSAGEKAKTADWYKLKVTKNQKLKITISAESSNGYFEFYLFGPSYKKYKNGVKMGPLKNQKGNYYSIDLYSNKKIKVQKGTYYIKAVRSSYSKQSSGIYTIKWK